MIRFEISEYQKQRPMIQLAPLIDVVFWALIFFMIIAAFTQIESEVDINVPKSTVATESNLSAGKIVINVSKDGKFFVNQQELDGQGLVEMLGKISKLFPNQQVVIRADAMSYHKYVVQALDACMRSNINDVSFSTIKEDN